eukprot:TRINITY_DN4048_c0_g1_i1.p1 TRINITY_DN4048_c0_g1~~TRINITY_DN4048_c0_g1_i1.p1  ORF type:complete len:310 (+),score=52.58 TRINITY_DN4048_c0_g1_i1:215-1144(+)
MIRVDRAVKSFTDGSVGRLCPTPLIFVCPLPLLYRVGGKLGPRLQTERGFASKVENRQALGISLRMGRTAAMKRSQIVQPENKRYTDQMQEALKEKSWPRALEAFRSATVPNSVLYSAIINIAAQLGHYKEGMELFNEMKAPRVEATYSSVFKVLRGLRDAEKAKILYQEMLSKLPDAKTNGPALTTYLNCLATLGSVQEVAAEMNAARKRGMKLDVGQYCVLLKLLRDLALAEKSFQVLTAMPKQNIRPDLVAYTTVLDTCTAEMTKSQDFSKASEYHSRLRALMEEQGIRKEDDLFKAAEKRLLEHA